MRLFYDVYSTRRRADLLLLGADQLAIITAIFFASGTLGRPDAIIITPLIIAWALIPRGVATFLGWFDRPQDFLRSLFFSALLCLFICVLIFSGWELIWQSSPYRIRVETAIAIVAAWSSGFLLFIPRAYKLSDFLLMLVVLLALLERQPHAWIFIPLFLFPFLVSAATRRLIYGVFRRRRTSRPNLQNVRALSAAATALLFAVFASLSFGLYGWLDARAPEPDGSNWMSGDWRFLPGGRDGKGRKGGFGSWGPDGPPGEKGPGNSRGKGSTGGRKIGYSEQIGLSDLAEPRFDKKIIFAARALDAEGKELVDAPPHWNPKDFLWKGTVYSKFDSRANAWAETKTYEKRDWPRNERIERNIPDANSELIHIEILVIKPVFRSLVAPYFTEALGPLDSVAKGSLYYESNMGDLYPDRPPLYAGSRYRLKTRTHATNSWPRESSVGTHDDARYLDVPSMAEVSIDLRAEAKRLGLDWQPDIQGKLSRLREYMEDKFQYSNRSDWRGGAEKLQIFLEEERVGDCVYFATSTCLLLRAAGVSTRLVVGFNGAERDSTRPARAYIRNFRAHSWTEVYFPGNGWYPLDATAWVAPAPSNVAPEMKLETEQQLADASNDATNDLSRRSRNRSEERRNPRDPDLPERTNASNSASEGDRDSELLESMDQDDLFAQTFHRPRGAERESWAQSLFPWRQQAEREASDAKPAREAKEAAESDDSIDFRATVLRSLLLVFTMVAGFLLVLTLLRPKKEEEEEEEVDDEDQGSSQIEKQLAILESLEGSALNSKEELLLIYHRLQQELVKTRNHRQPHQTPKEHGDRHKNQEEDLDLAIDTLNDSVYQTLYGDEEPSSDEISLARRNCRKILRHLG